MAISLRRRKCHTSNALFDFNVCTHRWEEGGRDEQHTYTQRQTHTERDRQTYTDTEREEVITGRKEIQSIITCTSSFSVTSACQPEDAFHCIRHWGSLFIHCVLEIGDLSLL